MSHIGADLAGQLVNDHRAELGEVTEHRGEGGVSDPTPLPITGAVGSPVNPQAIK